MIDLYEEENNDRYIPIAKEDKMRDWIDSMQARTKAQEKYDKEHTKGIYLKLNLRTDLDIIRWLWEQPSKQGAIKRLIREEIAHKNAEKAGSGNVVRRIVE